MINEGLFGFKKLLRANKPDSVILPEQHLCHLSSPGLTPGIHLPTPPDFSFENQAELA